LTSSLLIPPDSDFYKSHFIRGFPVAWGGQNESEQVVILNRMRWSNRIG